MNNDSHSAADQQSTQMYLTLGEASRQFPAHPSTNSLWRWARKGVQSRSGQRVRLQHLRVGGKILVTFAWIEEFGRKLAEADAAHFDKIADAGDCAAGVGTLSTRQAELDRVNAELREAGL